MRPTRAVLLTVATVLASALLATPAQAAKPKHDLVAKGYEQGASDRFWVKGKVPTNPGGNLRMLRSVGGGEFRVYKRVELRDSGKFKVRIYQVGREKTCFRVQVPGTALYRKTTSPNLGCILRDD